MMTSAEPRFQRLDQETIEAILSRNHVGRIAFARDQQIEIFPVHYVYADRWIYGRTTPGGTLHQVGETWWPVAFEVDEIDGLFDWRSVVVKGGLYSMNPDGAAWEREATMTAVALLRKLIPEALREGDPVPSRTTLFRIAVQEVTGRQAISS